MGEKLDMLREVLRQRAKCEEDWLLSRAQRIFYTIKATVALVLRRERRSFPRLYPGSLVEIDRIEVAVLNMNTWQSMEFGTMTDWDCVKVPKGFRGWWYVFDSDGAP